MKLLRIYTYILCVLLAAACAKDGERLTATIDGDTQMIVSSANDNIVLGNDQNSTLVLTLYWNELGQVGLSNPDAVMPDGVLSYTLQFSADDTFTSVYEHSIKPDAMSAQFTGSELNTILSKLEYPGGTPLPLYIRMKMQLGTNSEPQYGEAMSITVTAFAIDMSIVKLVNEDKTTVSGTISATGTKGEYAGFVSVSSWYRFYFVEGDGTIWGNNGVSGTPFQTSNDATQWNCWFPEPKGFYYVTLSTNTCEWTALSIPTVQATVDGTVLDMKYSSTLNCWSVVFTTSAADAAIGLNQNGTYYDQNTGDKAGIEKSFSFKAASDGTFAKAESGAESGIIVSTAGTYTLILYFNDMKWELAEGEKQVGGEEDGGDATEYPDDPSYTAATSDLIYILNKDDLSTAGKLLRNSDGIYQGFFYFTQWYNFFFANSQDTDTATIYGSAPVDGGLYRLYCGSERYNLWYENADAYTRVSVDMAARSWKAETIETIHIVGDFNDWGKDYPVLMTFDSASKTWSAKITPADWGECGIKFLFNVDTYTDWSWCLTDSDKDSKLEAGTSEFIPDVAAGKTYKVTLDLNDPEAMTYKLEEIQ